ncbi:MAG: phosphatidate cytidylyltransferase [Aliivibrio sp.]|uniref:phosphatidate cytidylyltransferase n=1 Tax=Aliivibrio sp. TaxID=1872443 RepID=UPI001A552E3F|nr:phosphatidate cytidylyltransferase [Aliivibrio sp.]
MKQRIITALILAPLVMAGIFFLPIQVFFIILVAVTLVGFWEWTQFVKAQSRIIALLPSVIALGASMIWLPFDAVNLALITEPHQYMLTIGVIWWLIASLLAMSYPVSAKLWQESRVLRHLFGWLSLIPFFWSIVLLRAQVGIDDQYYGAKLVLLVCLLVWSADSGAYFAGKSLGKRKMAPSVSPNKTVEGLIGGIVTAMIIGWGAVALFDIHFDSIATMIGIFMVTVIISVLGDLVESMFKRSSNIKDSGTIIPGHGGILDRIDSLIAAFPIFALLYFW